MTLTTLSAISIYTTHPGKKKENSDRGNCFSIYNIPSKTCLTSHSQNPNLFHHFLRREMRSTIFVSEPGDRGVALWGTITIPRGTEISSPVVLSLCGGWILLCSTVSAERRMESQARFMECSFWHQCFSHIL